MFFRYVEDIQNHINIRFITAMQLTANAVEKQKTDWHQLFGRVQWKCAFSAMNYGPPGSMSVYTC